jgi:nitrate reductase NapAB chaperone NapD
MAEMGGTTEPEPLLAPQSVEREQWRGYVLVCVNANVVKVCETVKERLGERFRGMSLVIGIYDLIVRVEADSKEQFKETLILVRETPGVISSVTLLDLN